MSLNVRQLRAMLAVVGTGTTTQAASILGLTQSAVSRLIIQLEAELGFRLFDRHRGRLWITPEGREFVASAERVVDEMQRIEDTAANVRLHGSGTLRVAAMPAIGTCMLPRAIRALRDEQPACRVIVTLMQRSELQQAVAEGRHDLGVATLPLAGQGLAVEPVCTVRAVMILPLDHHLAAKDVIGPEDVDGEDVVALSSDTVLRYRVEELFTRLGISRRHTVEANSTVMMGNCVELGLGIGLVHPFVADHFAGRVAVRPFEPALEMGYGLVTAKTARRRWLVDLFAAKIAACYPDAAATTGRAAREQAAAPAAGQAAAPQAAAERAVPVSRSQR